MFLICQNMDAKYHKEDPSKNLKEVMFRPDNIVQLFRELRSIA